MPVKKKLQGSDLGSNCDWSAFTWTAPLSVEQMAMAEIKELRKELTGTYGKLSWANQQLQECHKTLVVKVAMLEEKEREIRKHRARILDLESKNSLYLALLSMGAPSIPEDTEPTSRFRGVARS